MIELMGNSLIQINGKYYRITKLVECKDYIKIYHNKPKIKKKPKNG